MTVSPAASARFHDLVVKDSTPNLKHGKVSDGYRYFPIPGMSHCRDGDGPWHFGSITQNVSTLRTSPTIFELRETLNSN